eukprot:TRINITY_DN5249_c0_g1_i2.p1 TRINITY_DN5249_c0_g1~~TRINITY_DN5249_c0_g1_i2.p1  ORF type:complete len:162 (-),score=43.76 TRINITY_DN5249_c0_g1_i2:72-557(-)
MAAARLARARTLFSSSLRLAPQAVQLAGRVGNSAVVGRSTSVAPVYSATLTPVRRFAAAAAADGDQALQQAIDSHDVVMFTSPTCGFCAEAEVALQKAKVDYKKVEVTPDYKSALIARTGKGSVPSVWIKGEYVGGCNDGTKPWHGVIPMLRSGKFQEMLK